MEHSANFKFLSLQEIGRKNTDGLKDNEKTFFKSSLILFPKFIPYFSIMSSSKIFNSFSSYTCSEKYFSACYLLQ